MNGGDAGRDGWHAYVDESIRAEHPGTGHYVLGATLVHAADAETVRGALLAAAPGKQRLHWRKDTPLVRQRAVAALAGSPALHLGVIGHPLDLRHQERARRQCLRRLLWELDSAGVSTVTLESRTATLNRRDLAVVRAFREQGVVRATEMRVAHMSPFAEPLLWAADIVAAVCRSPASGLQQHRAALAPLITEHTVRLD